MDIEAYRIAIRLGHKSANTALYEATDEASKSMAMMAGLYCEFVRDNINDIEYGVQFYYHKHNPCVWASPADFFEFVNGCFGHAMELGAFLADYTSEKDPDKAKAMLSAKQAKDEEQHIDWTARREAGESAAQIAETEPVSKRTVERRLRQKDRHATKNVAPEKRKRTTYQIQSGTKPETAAQRIREVFGEEFAQQLKVAL